MALEIRASDIRDLEDFAMDIAYKQDAGHHTTNKKEVIVLNDFKKYWINDSKEGSVIKICYGEDERVLTIRCNWSDRQRSNDGRVSKKSNSETSSNTKVSNKSHQG